MGHGPGHDSTKKQNKKKINRPVSRPPPSPKTPHPKKPGFLYIFFCCIAGWWNLPQERLYHVYPELAYFGPARSGEVVGLKEAEKTTPVTPAPSTLRDQSLCQEDPVTHEKGNRRGTLGIFRVFSLVRLL